MSAATVHVIVISSHLSFFLCAPGPVWSLGPEGPQIYPEREEQFWYAAQQLPGQADGGQGPSEMYSGRKRVGESDWGQGKRKRKGAASFSVSQ